MKIVYVVHQFYPENRGGTERFVLNLATSMQRSGHHADIVSYSLNKESSVPGGAGLLVRKYRYKALSVTATSHVRTPLEINTGLWDPAVLQFAIQFLQNRSYDLVHIAHPMRLFPFVNAAAQLGIPYLVTLTDFWMICPKINLRTSFDTLCTGPAGGRVCAQFCPELKQEFLTARLESARKMLRGAAAVVGPSELVAGLVSQEFGDLVIHVLPHGLKLSDFKPVDTNYDQNSRIVFAYCGGLSPHKGVLTLVNAFRRLESEKAELRIYGAASSHEKAYERSLQNGAAGDQRIKFCGTYKEDEIATVFQGIDVLVIPSLCYETYSYTLHEALASNVPVIASAVGCLDREIQNGVTGFLFPIGDEAALLGKLCTVMENPPILMDLKKGGGLWVSSVEEEAYLYERLYHRVVNQPKLRPQQ